MRKAFSVIVTLSLFCGLTGVCAFGQVSQGYLNDVGSTAYGVNIPVENGFINISNGNLHLEFPLASPPQRGALALNERLAYDSRIWMFSPFGTHGSYHWWPYNVPGSSTTSGGWRFIRGDEVGTISYAQAAVYSQVCTNSGGKGGDPDPLLPEEPVDPGGGSQQYDTTFEMQVIWTDPGGTAHPTSAMLIQDYNQCGANQPNSLQGGTALDGSGYTVSDDGAGNPIVTSSDHTEVYPQVVDRYGNYFSKDAQGNLMDDTGRVPVIVTQNGNATYYDVLAPNGPIQNNGTRVRYTVTTAPISVSTDFKPFNQSDIYPWTSPNDLTPVQSIQLPDGSQYTFGYDRDGELSSMTLPTGGIIHYAYGNFLDSGNTENRWLESRTVGSNPAMTFTPMVGSSCSNYSSGCIEYDLVQKPSGDTTMYELTLANGAWNTGTYTFTGPVPIHTGLFNRSGGNLKPLLFTTSVNTYSNACSGTTCRGANYVTKSLATTELFANGSPTLYSQTQSTFDPQTGQPTSVKTWDYGFPSNMNTSAPPSYPPWQEVDYTYAGGLPSTVKVIDASLNQAALTTYTYTSTATATSGLPQHGSQNAGGPYLQSVTRWLNTDPTHSPTTTYVMDDSGMTTQVQDANGNPPTQTSYQCSDSLPFQSTNALQQVTQFGYDCPSGAITSVQNPNDLAAGRAGTTYTYEATAGRLYTETRPDGGVTTYTYPSAVEVDNTTTATPDPAIVSANILDSFGRPSQTVLAGAVSETTYDVNGRPSCTSNPHLQSDSTSGFSCVTSYDGLDRPLVVQQQDRNTRQFSYSANTITSSDEQGTSSVRTMNALGQLIKVVEAGTPSTPLSLETDYAYDGLGNLKYVNQVGQPGVTSPGFANPEQSQARGFVYDSLSRLVTATSPETNNAQICYGTWNSGTCQGGYDANGNLLHKTDAFPLQTDFTYDALNRLVLKTANDNYPARHFIYDQGNNGIGRLWAEYVDGAAGTMYSYDSAGRITGTQWYDYAHGTWTNGMTVQHDLAGNPKQLIYPNGAVLQQTFDAAGRLQSITDATPNGPGTVYFQPDAGWNQYLPSGALGRAVLGNGVLEQFVLNSRLQPCHSVAESPVQPSSGAVRDQATGMYILLDRVLLHGQTGEPVCGVAAGNNGNIWHILEENGGQQNFAYDNLNRLTSAYSANRASGATYSFTYNYDSFGNMLPTDNQTGYAPYSIDPSNNHLLNGQDITYYPNGWQATANGHSFWYTAEGLLRSIDAYSTGSYLYNAQGERTLSVRNDRGDHSSFSASENVYLGGEPMAEYHLDSAAVPWTWTNFVYANGQRIARLEGSNPKTPVAHYYLGDQLGTAQMELDATGAVTWKGWYTPFGQEITAGWASNYVGNQPNDGTAMHYKFAGLESDQESGLDHAMFRNYAPMAGRWMSPDPYDGSIDPNDPQSLNRYAYVSNSPLLNTDPSGLVALPPGAPASGALCGPVCLGVVLGGEAIYEIGRYLGWWSHAPFTASHTPRPSASNQKNWLNSDTFAVPYQSVFQLGRIAAGGCEFGGCGTVGTDSLQQGAATAPISWCAAHPSVCTLGADAAALARAIPAVAASAMLLNMKGDNTPKKDPAREACYTRLFAEQDRCSAKYGGGGRFGNNRAKGACLDRAFYRYEACVNGTPDPGPPMASLEKPEKDREVADVVASLNAIVVDFGPEVRSANERH